MLPIVLSQRSATCYEPLSEALQNILEDKWDEISSLPRTQSHDCARDIISEVLSTTYSAISAFSRVSNAAYRDPISALPSELICECFGWLDLRSRISASHVSRSWRSLMISDFSLWSEYTIPDGTRCTKAADCLQALLSRSDPAPFRFTCYEDVTDALRDIILRNMHRMQMLCLDIMRRDLILRVMARDAPMLEEFYYRNSPEPDVPIELTWSSAPLLQNLSLGRFLMPSGGVFSALRLFSGTLPEGYSLPGTMASVFPVLEDVQLKDITQRSLELLLPLPRSIKILVLQSTRSGPLDYTALFQDCETIDLVYLSVDSASSLSDAVALIARAPRAGGRWDLHLVGDNSVVLGADPETNYDIECHEDIRLLAQPATMSRLHGIEDLTLPVRDYVGLYQLSTWPRAFPTLTRLTLIYSVPEDAGRPRNQINGRAIEALLLKHVIIRIKSESPDDCVAALPDVAPLIGSLVGSKLASVVLLAEEPEFLVDADLSCLRGLAECILVRGFRNDQPMIMLEDE